MMFKELDQILNMRNAPEAPEYLARQIIAQAAGMPQGAVAATKARFDIGRFWAELKDMVAIPAPAYAFAVVLVLGLGAGMVGDISVVLPGLTTNELSGFLEINDGFIAGEWL